MIFWHDILNEIRHVSWMQRFVWLNAVLFVAGALTVPKLASTTFTLLALTGIVLLARGRWPLDLTRAEKWLLLAFALYFIVGVVSYNLGVKTRLGWEIIFRDIRFLFAIPIYIVLRRYPLPRSWFWLMLVIAGLAAVGVATVNYLSEQDGWRASGGTISIVFGHLMAGMTLICVAGILFLQGRGIRILVIAGALAGVLVIFLSGTRGALLSLSGAIITLSFIGYKVFNGWRLSILVLLIAIVAVIGMTQAQLRTRIDNAVTESVAYFHNSKIVHQIPALVSAGCIKDYELMKNLENKITTWGSGKLVIRIIEDASVMASEFSDVCKTNHVFRVENISREHTAWFYTASRSVTPESACGAELLVRGQGSFQIAGKPDSRKVFDTGQYQKLELQCDSTYDHRLIGILPPGAQLYFIPIARYPGEYRFFYADSSVGARFAMWGAAWNIFLSSPILGSGPGSFPVLAAKLATEGEVPGIAAWFDHAHNEIMTILADRGLAGLAALLLLYGAPFWLFVQALRQTTNRAEPVAGLLLVGGFMLSGLTETLFNHSLVITYYAVFISLLAVLSRQPPAKESS